MGCVDRLFLWGLWGVNLPFRLFTRLNSSGQAGSPPLCARPLGGFPAPLPMPTTLPLPSWCMATPPTPQIPSLALFPPGQAPLPFSPPTPSQVFAWLPCPPPATCVPSPLSCCFPHLLLYLMKVAVPCLLILSPGAGSAVCCHVVLLGTWSGAAGAQHWVMSALLCPGDSTTCRQ